MNPMHWIRWKVLIAVTVVTAGLSGFGVGPLAKTVINHTGAAGHGAYWSVRGVSFNPLAGRVSLSGVQVDHTSQSGIGEGAMATASNAQVLAAESLTFDLAMTELLRKRYCGQMHMKAPKLVFERREDQTVHANLDQLQPSEVSEPIDWWAEIQQYVQKLQQWNEQYRKVEERIPEDKLTQSSREVATQKRSPFKVDYSRRVTYPFEQRANFVAISLLGEGLEIEFVDSASQSRGHAAIPPLKNGRILIEHVSDNPAQHHEPIRWTLTGDIAGAPIKLAGILDERLKRPGANQAVPSHLSLDFHAEGLPAELVQFFAGSSLPMHFEEGSITLAGTLSMDGWNELNVRPVFGFRDVVVSPQAGSQSIVGVSPEVFCRAMNEVGTLEISDLRITGTVANPRVKTGDTLANLVRSGGKAFAKKQIAKGMQMGTEKITQAVDEELDKLNANGTLPPEMGKAVDQVKKGLGDRLKGLPFGEKPGAARK